mmetsp:Transcript_16713/g.63521  ORF Transcript_16713/g.63521 Transcript_16713/m.63521 type:complete len:296 (-) Transcript_16713:640-1527(-)
MYTTRPRRIFTLRTPLTSLSGGSVISRSFRRRPSITAWRRDTQLRDKGGALLRENEMPPLVAASEGPISSSFWMSLARFHVGAGRRPSALSFLFSILLSFSAIEHLGECKAAFCSLKASWVDACLCASVTKRVPLPLPTSGMTTIADLVLRFRSGAARRLSAFVPRSEASGNGGGSLWNLATFRDGVPLSLPRSFESAPPRPPSLKPLAPWWCSRVKAVAALGLALFASLRAIRSKISRIAASSPFIVDVGGGAERVWALLRTSKVLWWTCSSVLAKDASGRDPCSPRGEGRLGL